MLSKKHIQKILKIFIKALSSDNKSIRAIYFDLADEQQTKEVINRLIGEKITLDVLVNNAAIAGGSSVEMTSLKSLRNIFEINFFSQIFAYKPSSQID